MIQKVSNLLPEELRTYIRSIRIDGVLKEKYERISQLGGEASRS